MSERLKSQNLWLIPAAIIALVILGAIALPNFIRARTCSCQNACINNLRLIDGAKQQWSLENKKSSTDIATISDLQTYLGRGTNGTLPFCPNDTKHTFNTSYQINAVGKPPTCKARPDSDVLP